MSTHSISRKQTSRASGKKLSDLEVPEQCAQIETVFVALLAKVVDGFRYEAVWWLFPFYHFDRSPARERIFGKVRSSIESTTEEYVQSVEPFFDRMLQVFKGLTATKKEGISKELRRIDDFFHRGGRKRNKKKRKRRSLRSSHHRSVARMEQSEHPGGPPRILLPIKTQLNVFQKAAQGEPDQARSSGSRGSTTSTSSS